MSSRTAWYSAWKTKKRTNKRDTQVTDVITAQVGFLPAGFLLRSQVPMTVRWQEAPPVSHPTGNSSLFPEIWLVFVGLCASVPNPSRADSHTPVWLLGWGSAVKNPKILKECVWGDDKICYKKLRVHYSQKDERENKLSDTLPWASYSLPCSMLSYSSPWFYN